MRACTRMHVHTSTNTHTHMHAHTHTHARASTRTHVLNAASCGSHLSIACVHLAGGRGIYPGQADNRHARRVEARLVHHFTPLHVVQRDGAVGVPSRQHLACTRACARCVCSRMPPCIKHTRLAQAPVSGTRPQPAHPSRGFGYSLGQCMDASPLAGEPSAHNRPYGGA